MARLSEYAAGELPDTDAERVAEHVEHCDDCRRMVEALRLVGPALSAVGTGRPIEEVDHTFALARAGARAARDGLEAGRPVEPERHRPTRRAWLGAAVAMAAGVLLTLGIAQQMQRTQAPDAADTLPGQFTAKGGNTAELEEINLSFSVQSTAGIMSRGQNGGRYSGEDLLYFRVNLPKEGHLLLARVGSDGIEPLTTPDQRAEAVTVERGDWDLSDGTHLLGFSLDRLKGTQRFVALYSPRPFSLTPSIRSALLSGADGASLRRQDLVVDEIRVEVAP